MLLESEIDISRTVQYITEEGLQLNIATLFEEAFKDKVMDVFQYDNDVPEYNENDFEIYYNGALDTRIYIKTGKYQLYKEKYPELIEEIENYMDMEFYEAVY